ncbi:MAG: DUF58 domain-containing protein [Planctomycetota bacterium]|jgi:uncharacterized protein (DUF58 family)|nr:DUF58 domain-containing protein [Planctomycetota bacterium]MDP7250825.1 DUF58 domain-containing protein [Planctomycetota bacterium]
MTAESELFDPEFLDRLRALFFKLRKRRQLKKKGIQPTPAPGFTREFKDHRQYTPGDDFRAIDWRLFARLEKVFIRIFEEIQEFHIHIVVDRSRSMFEPHEVKRTVALQISVALAYLGLINQHRVSLMSMSEEVQRELPPLKGQGHIHSVLKTLSQIEFEGVTDLTGALSRFRPGKDRRGIIFLISDLFGRSPELSFEALSAAHSWGAETHVIHVLHPNELHPDLEGEIQLLDVETRELRRMWLTKREMSQYEKTFEAYIQEIKQACMRQQLNYMTWTTDDSFEDMFLTLLSRGSALAGK